jgi:A/G-specific adenine glycosylase
MATSAPKARPSSSTVPKVLPTIARKARSIAREQSGRGTDVEASPVLSKTGKAAPAKGKRAKADHQTRNVVDSEAGAGGDLEPELVDLDPFDRQRIALAWAWMQQHRRDLPWRRTRDPWAVLVAELMLQQTQVARVLDRWPTFLEQFPNPQAAADAGSAAIVTAWSGLGYNRRALALHRCAVLVSERHNATLPQTIDELQKLPGIGGYTARAVRAFAFARPAAVVDTNVARIVARAFAGRALSWKEAQQLADACVPEEAHAGWVWGWNQGMLDLGASICTKRAPKCQECPIQTHCVWQLRQQNGRQNQAGTNPDPAIGSAGVGTTQSRFEGSDRQGRGRLIHALRQGPVPFDQMSSVMGWPDDGSRANRVADTLLKDGLVTRNEATHAFTLA